MSETKKQPLLDDQLQDVTGGYDFKYSALPKRKNTIPRLPFFPRRMCSQEIPMLRLPSPPVSPPSVLIPSQPGTRKSAPDGRRKQPIHQTWRKSHD